MRNRPDVGALVAAFPDLRLLTIEEASALTRIPDHELAQLCRDGTIVARRHGEHYRIPPAAIRAYYADLIEGRRREGARRGQPSKPVRRPPPLAERAT